MRADLPPCTFKNCKYNLENNCTNVLELQKCEFARLKQDEFMQNLNNIGFENGFTTCPFCGHSFWR